MTRDSFNLGRRVLAWSIHLFTASGAVYGLLAVLAIERREPTPALLWLGLAMFVDAVDGTIARAVRVNEVLPRFDGRTLDLIIDYFTCVIIPAYFIHQFVPLPEGARLLCAAAILVSAQIHYGDRDAMTADHYFVGFPAEWNMVAFYLFAFQLTPWASLAIIALFCALTLLKVYCVHPFRVQELRRVTIAVTLIWGAVNVLILLQHPAPSPWLKGASVITLLYLGWRGALRTMRGKSAERSSATATEQPLAGGAGMKSQQ
ncbi:MAG: hypothetical protein JXB05_12175 [Myxococcaceae bacterium]|nr:hypothetical protein [Myxococcaceae bacterium]